MVVFIEFIKQISIIIASSLILSVVIFFLNILDSDHSCN